MKCRECGEEVYEYEDGLCYDCEESDDGHTNIIEMTTMDDWCT